jgi:DNA replication protein DnaC
MPTIVRSLSLVDRKLLEVLHDLAEGRAAWPLFLYGPAGSGKTCAALAFADTIKTATFATVDGLSDAVMRHQADVIWSRVKNKDLAILDELGARQTVTDLGYTVVKEFADLREQYANRAAVYISNADPKGIHRLYDDRIASRVLSGTVFHLLGQDRRFA